MNESTAVFSFGIALGAGVASIIWGVFCFFIATDRMHHRNDEFHGDQF